MLMYTVYVVLCRATAATLKQVAQPRLIAFVKDILKQFFAIVKQRFETEVSFAVKSSERRAIAMSPMCRPVVLAQCDALDAE